MNVIRTNWEVTLHESSLQDIVRLLEDTRNVRSLYTFIATHILIDPTTWTAQHSKGAQILAALGVRMPKLAGITSLVANNALRAPAIDYAEVLNTYIEYALYAEAIQLVESIVRAGDLTQAVPLYRALFVAGKGFESAENLAEQSVRKYQAEYDKFALKLYRELFSQGKGFDSAIEAIRCAFLCPNITSDNIVIPLCNMMISKNRGIDDIEDIVLYASTCAVYQHSTHSNLYDTIHAVCRLLFQRNMGFVLAVQIAEIFFIEAEGSIKTYRCSRQLKSVAFCLCLRAIRSGHEYKAVEKIALRAITTYGSQRYGLKLYTHLFRYGAGFASAIRAIEDVLFMPQSIDKHHPRSIRSKATDMCSLLLAADYGYEAIAQLAARALKSQHYGTREEGFQLYRDLFAHRRGRYSARETIYDLFGPIEPRVLADIEARFGEDSHIRMISLRVERFGRIKVAMRLCAMSHQLLLSIAPDIESFFQGEGDDDLRFLAAELSSLLSKIECLEVRFDFVKIIANRFIRSSDGDIVSYGYNLCKLICDENSVRKIVVQAFRSFLQESIGNDLNIFFFNFSIESLIDDPAAISSIADYVCDISLIAAFVTSDRIGMQVELLHVLKHFVNDRYSIGDVEEKVAVQAVISSEEDQVQVAGLQLLRALAAQQRAIPSARDVIQTITSSAHGCVQVAMFELLEELVLQQDDEGFDLAEEVAEMTYELQDPAAQAALRQLLHAIEREYCMLEID